jgi:hypothetical protein
MLLVLPGRMSYSPRISTMASSRRASMVDGKAAAAGAPHLLLSAKPSVNPTEDIDNYVRS